MIAAPGRLANGTQDREIELGLLKRNNKIEFEVEISRERKVGSASAAQRYWHCIAGAAGRVRPPGAAAGGAREGAPSRAESGAQHCGESLRSAAQQLEEQRQQMRVKVDAELRAQRFDSSRTDDEKVSCIRLDAAG